MQRDFELPPIRRVAIVHEWFVNHAGSEKVVEQLLAIWPDAELFCVVDFLPEAERGFIRGKATTTSFIQHLPRAKKSFRSYLPLMPLAIEQLDVSGFDLVVSSSHAVAKGVITGPDQLHVSYVHSPMRYAWDLQGQYLREAGIERGLKSWIARASLHYLRLWDVRSSVGVDAFAVNSNFIRRRVEKFYRREAEVIYPPVDVTRFQIGAGPREAFYLTASRLVPYKKVHVIAEAFAAMPEKRLVIIGEGPEMEKVKRAAGANVTLLGYQSAAVLVDHMQRAKAFVFAAEEDFGIVPVEAQACGTPVVALAKGGSLETVRHRGDPALRTGLLFAEQTPASIADAVRRFESDGIVYSAESCRSHAEGFAPEVFRARFEALVGRAWAEFHAAPALLVR
jgi:glycosyltransferase involved in cell wall biosynthesis